MFSQNPAAIDILKENLDKINWKGFSQNPAIFEINYEYLKEKIEPFKEELIEKSLHPLRMERFLMEYNYDLLEDVYWDD